MRVAIAQVDGKWPNLALAKIAAWHRQQGDEVDFFKPILGADRVYASKVFTDTPDDPYLPEDAIRGGSGYDLATVLPDEVERTKPDWSLWPWWHKDAGYSTRGCVRRCPFCIVPEKEGKIEVVASFGDLWTGRPFLTLFDNNATAAPMDHFRELCADATAARVKFDFNQALDCRLFNVDHAAALVRSTHFTTLRFAFDSMAVEPDVRRTIRLCAEVGIRPTRLMFYVLVGYNTTRDEDMDRVTLLRSLGVDPFVMRFDRGDPYQTRFSRWVNNMTAFNSLTWDEWQARFKTKLATS